MSKLTEKIQAAKDMGRMALIPFLPAGYPDKDAFWKHMRELDDAGADIIEIGMPFSDPVADGPVVEAASLKALENGASVSWILAELKDAAPFSAALVLMGYYNPVLQYGLEKFAAQAAEAGISGIILPDVPYEEADAVRAALEKHGVDLIPLVGLNTSRERMQLYARSSRGFAYFVSVMGTTGAREALPEKVREGLRMAGEVFDIPLALGFGLKHPDQLAAMNGLVDAAVFGSALITHIEDGGSAAEFMARWK